MKKSRMIVAMLLVFTMSAVCHAAPIKPSPYVSGFLGATVINDTGVTTNDLVNNQTFNDRVTFDPGIFVSGSGGYDFGFIRLEGELSYRGSEISSITNQSNGSRFLGVKGNLGALAMMFNTYLDLHNDSPVTPYVGGGIGFADLRLSDTFGTVPGGQRFLLYGDDDATVFAYQIGAGLGFAINRQFTLDVGYRYFGTENATFSNNAAGIVDLKFESHSAVVGLRMKF
jgi:opacity protein-like surface antigen